MNSLAQDTQTNNPGRFAWYFTNARDNSGAPLACTDFDSFALAIRAGIEHTIPDPPAWDAEAVNKHKTALPAFGPYVLTGERRCNENVGCITALRWDVDAMSADESAALFDRIRACGYRGFAYESPSSGLACKGTNPRFQLVLQPERALLPHEALSAKAVIAAELGIAFDPGAEKLSQIAFVGRFESTPPRQWIEFHGAPVRVPAYLGPAPTVPAWSSPPARATDAERAGYVQQAPEASPLAVELITTRELTVLAQKLTHSKNEHKQSVGRALHHALAGRLWAADHRDDMAYMIAAECVEQYPNLDAKSTVNCFSAAVSNAQSHGSDITLDKWQKMLERVQNARQTRLNMVGQFAARNSAAGEALSEQAKRTWPVQTPVVEQPPALPEPFRAIELPSGVIAPAHPTDALASVFHSLVIVADGSFYLRLPGETHYRWRARNWTELRLLLARKFGVQNQTIVTHDGKGNALPESQWLEVYAHVAQRTVHDYTSERTTWEEEKETLHIGLPAELPKAVPALDVHDWLAVIAGSEPAVIELYDWIAASTREHISRPAAALAFVGPDSVGKGMFVRALARTWGPILPVPLSNANERFNGSLLHSPFWHFDEKVHLEEDRFRVIVQERERLIELKGKEKVELRGCSRCIFTVNEPEKLSLGGAIGPSAFNATVIRIAYFDFRDRQKQILSAVAPLLLENGDMDLDRIVAHLRWVQTDWARENNAPRVQRFLGARADSAEAEALVLAGTRDADTAGVLEALADYLRDPWLWEAGYHADDNPSSGPGKRYPALTQGGELYVHADEMAARRGVRGVRELAEARKALAGVRADRGNGDRISVGNKDNPRRLRYWRVDVNKLLKLVGGELDNHVSAALAVDTCKRRLSVNANEVQGGER